MLVDAKDDLGTGYLDVASHVEVKRLASSPHWKILEACTILPLTNRGPVLANLSRYQIHSTMGKDPVSPVDVQQRSSIQLMGKFHGSKSPRLTNIYQLRKTLVCCASQKRVRVQMPLSLGPLLRGRTELKRKRTSLKPIHESLNRRLTDCKFLEDDYSTDVMPWEKETAR